MDDPQSKNRMPLAHNTVYRMLFWRRVIFFAVISTTFTALMIAYMHSLQFYRFITDPAISHRPLATKILDAVSETFARPDLAGHSVSAISGLRGLRADASGTKNGLRRAAVRAATRHAFEGYTQHAWGFDELRPVTGDGVDNFMPPEGFRGLTVIDSIDTLALMGLDDLLQAATEWMQDFGKKGFGSVGVVGVFESVIRLLGGLIGAWEVTREDVFLEKADQLGQAFTECFLDANQLPLSRLNVSHDCSAYSYASTVPAEVNLIMEWRAMARARGGVFQEVLKSQRKVIKTLQDEVSFGGLIPSNLAQRPFAGNKIGIGRDASVGAPSDSYYEYFIKSLLVTQGTEPEWSHYWWQVVDTVLDILVVNVPGFGLVLTDTNRHFVQSELRKTVGSGRIKMDHFSCFLPGLLYMSADLVPPSGTLSSERRAEILKTARGLTESCINMYNTSSGLSGENIRVFSDGRISFEGQYILRPEVVEALFYESRLAPEPAVRARAQDEAWKIFQAIEEHSKTEFGYSTIRNPNAPIGSLEKADGMPSFFIAETLKYLYLTFQDESEKDTHVMDLKEWVLTTEAHPIHI